MTIPLESLKDILMITSDAYEVGEITDVRYDPFEWDVKGLKIKARRSSGKLSAGFGKTAFMFLPQDFVLNDVMLLSQPIEIIKDAIVPDNNNISSLSSMINAKVVTRDNALVGTVVTAMIDTELWKVSSIIVRLDKTAIEAMKMKKSLFSKINVEIRANIILSSTDMVHLDEQMDGVREKMAVLD
ncbi:MAG: hypothetical protein LBV13_02105 [Methanomassiliicoccaceae archaeon]|jgi:sporulation protein YlmC with PRC-barrel domain|nr:hypothetical protein [Methanomassiliicoccaceae archaeon]